jgi:DNA invertase Pin-like site-specific DNA recombinase
MNASTKKAPLRAALYARQSVTEEDGIKRQISECTALAKRRDFNVVAEYVDDNVSSYKARAETTAYAQLLRDAKERKFDVLIVRKLDRLTRHRYAIDELQETGVLTITADGDLDLTSPQGRLMANVLTVFSHAESEIKAERRVFANAGRRAEGVPTSGRVPFGFVWVPSSERTAEAPEAYQLDPERAPVVRQVFDEFLAGVTVGAITRQLNESGVRTVPTKSQPDGAPFRPTTVRRMLMSPYYAALLPIPSEKGKVYDQAAITRADCVEGAWPAIVAPDEWQEAKTRLTHPDRKTSPGPSRKWLLSGIATCGACDEPIRAGGGEAGIHSYRCRSMKHFMRRGVPLDEFVENLVLARLSRPDAADLLLDRERPDIEALRAERRRLETSLDATLDEWQDGLITTPQKVRLLKRGNARIAEIDQLTMSGVNVDAFSSVVGQPDVEAAWTSLSLGRQRAIVEALMTIRVHSVGQGNRRRMSAEAMAKTVDIHWHE